MKNIYIIMISGLLLSCSKDKIKPNNTESEIMCPSNNPIFTKETAEFLIKKWGKTLQKYNGKADGDIWINVASFVADNYDSTVVLLPTINPKIKVGPQQVYDYFVRFLAEDPKMVLVGNELIKFGCGFGLADGYYDFILYPDKPKSTITVHARYTFAYIYHPQKQIINIKIESGIESGVTKQFVQPAGWYIDVQHSSKVPHLK